MKHIFLKLFWKSLRTRITLLILITILVGTGLMTVAISHTLRHDIERLLTEQQTALATHMGNHLDGELADRLKALTLVAPTLLASLRAGPDVLQAELGPVTLWCTPDTTHPEFAACAAHGPLTLRQQAEGDLGNRMLATINGPTLIIGTDCPALTPEHLQQAASVLSENDAVLIPAEDGGYVLIGLRQPTASIFAEMTWGCATVLEQTRLRLRAACLRWVELPSLWDIDEPADLPRLTAFAPELLSPQ